MILRRRDDLINPYKPLRMKNMILSTKMSTVIFRTSIARLSLVAAFVTGFASDAGGQNSLNLTVVGTTSTQAILQYTAPSTAACTIEVSESASFFPLVHDVEPNLFPQANLDTRSGNLVNGQARVAVIGKRNSETAINQNTYSRALQANT